MERGRLSADEMVWFELCAVSINNSVGEEEREIIGFELMIIYVQQKGIKEVLRWCGSRIKMIF